MSLTNGSEHLAFDQERVPDRQTSCDQEGDVLLPQRNLPVRLVLGLPGVLL